MVAPLPVPLTRAKLPRSITIKGLPDLTLDFTTAPASALVSELAAAKRIGAVEKIAVDQRIDLHEWRELDADLGGQIVEWAPGKEEITLTLTGIVLYTGDVIDAFGFDVDTLLAIRAPFVLEIAERRPVAGGTTQSRSTYFLGCRFSTRPFEADIGSADLIRMSYEAKAARVLRTAFQ